MTDLLVYGSYGYTGDLVARRAVESGREPVLAGRREEPLREQADELGLASRAFELADAAANLDGIDVVVHCAGPFVHTYEPMVEACLATGTHYLDVTGEIDVFEALQGEDARAEDAGVMVLPGAGFDVVPSDCLANHLHDRFPSATHLRMALRGMETVSPGTARTAIEGLGEPSYVREGGRLTAVPMGSHTREIDTGDGPRLAMAIPWGDVSTAHYSTGIPNVEVYAPTSRGALRALRVVDALSPALGSRPVERALKHLVDATVSGPDERERAAGEAVVWGEATDGDRTVRSRVRTPEPYEFTARAVLTIAARALDGDAPAGYRTPASAYGSDLVLDVEGCELADLA